MEKQHDMTLMKPRSYRSVLMTGFRLYTENFRRLFKASWQMALLYAIACGAFGTLAVIKLPEMAVALIQQLTVYHGLFQETLVQYFITSLEILGLLLLLKNSQMIALQFPEYHPSMLTMLSTVLLHQMSRVEITRFMLQAQKPCQRLTVRQVFRERLSVSL